MCVDNTIWRKSDLYFWHEFLFCHNFIQVSKVSSCTNQFSTLIIFASSIGIACFYGGINGLSFGYFFEGYLGGLGGKEMLCLIFYF